MGEWKKETLGNLSTLFNGDRGKNYPCNADIVAEGFPFINAGHLLNGKVDFSSCDYITEHKFKSLRGAKLQYGDIIYCLRGTIGKNAFYSAAYSGTIASSLVAIRPQNVDSLFLYQVLNSESEEKQRKMSDNGTAQPNLSADSVIKYTFFMPTSIKEQQKIAEILTTVDIVIEKTRALIEKYRNIKTGLMQDLLANGIDEQGNIRSPQTHKYIDSPLGRIPVEWDCMRFDQVMPLQRGHDLPQYKITQGDYPVACSNGIIAMHNKYSTKGPCVWTGRSGTIGHVFYSEKNCWMHNTSLWVTSFCGNDEKFIFYLLSSFDLKKYLAGTGVPTLNRNDLHIQKVILPKSKDEQREIVKKLDAAGKKIQSEQDYLTKLLNIKKGLMQDLLTHKIPVDILL